MSSAQKPVRSETQLDERNLIYTFVHVHLLTFISPSGGLCGERSLSKRGQLAANRALMTPLYVYMFSVGVLTVSKPTTFRKFVEI